MSTSGCYTITHRESGKIYVGSAIDIHGRWRSHRSDLNHRKHHNSHLQYAWDKYGEDAFEFEILAICPEDMVKEVEQSYLDEIFANPKPNKIAYNLNRSAVGFASGEYHPRPWLGKQGPLTDKPVSQETRRKISTALKGNKSKYHTDAMKVKISQSMIKSDYCRNRPKKTCPWCGKTAAVNMYMRWHGDNCKHKEKP
jgi:group I intron endonuclease